ncbi:hypothetical protein K493DRAFT_364322 [Basidiobolus meristosporus CBS 931.73]|uniref:Uncharacterized protein n=1 Tax=Basidiobolus meristosporus CBS 931.73 TaxID=1314790 RepID=A0A1Y1WDZ0_9FUNG|nr:hypothetical protein K493DRAFT_364322 [Basidiobolus meristosporus CBS 931.73]|eukprot:ORX71741.1 hypothetical protein K493DRAFT_364322 [Basidiobolus meristosporus CBS 931.73]
MPVQEIKAIYGAPECYTSSVATEDILTNLKSPEHTLGSYQQALGRIQQLLNSYDRRFWKLLQEMYVALQNLYNNIANRGEATKDKIANAVKRGTYDFVFQERVDVLLNYRGESKQTSLAELQDLCGRARLYAKSAMSEAKSLSLGAGKDEEHMVDIMHEFVQIVDTIQGMIPIATKLIRLGHLKYINFVRKAVRKSKLVALATELKEDLQDLLFIIGDAQRENYYLTFYNPHDFLIFYQYFYQIVTQAMLIFRLNATIYFDSTTRKRHLSIMHSSWLKITHLSFRILGVV